MCSRQMIKLPKKNRKTLDKHRVFSVNVMGAIGSGKTTLIEEAVRHLKEKYRTAVIAGDVIAEMDAPDSGNSGCRQSL
ncbi:GTP-binding protein [Methanosarcina horonobensis]|uniref:GTP-binding protein n=1 Tax=Methanosarcina horonobensis TaxID=418008 RepID=UPI000A3F116C|nr:GTP-binding protein [Methanosarcina horonobensis]